MKFLIDTNVVLDLLLDRMPFADDAAQLFDQAERGNISAVLCGTTVTTIFYIAAKTIGARTGRATRTACAARTSPWPPGFSP